MTTEFKKGDKVRYTAAYGDYSEPRCKGAEGVVVEVLGVDEVRVDWAETENRRPSLVVFPQNLEVIEESAPKVGDRVRLVHEGVVTDITRGSVYLDGKSRVLGQGETVEILERAPKAYAPGTFVTSPTGSFLPMARTADGKWLNVTAGVETYYNDASIQRFIDRGDLVVTHEPPQSA